MTPTRIPNWYPRQIRCDACRLSNSISRLPLALALELALSTDNGIAPESGGLRTIASSVASVVEDADVKVSI
jgi:hypothetical protein